MPARLYLDTARLGLMSRSAQQIQIDFARFVGEEAGSLYFDRLLKNGTHGWPNSFQRRYPALRAWQGVSHLKDRLRRLAEAPPEREVLLANRSAQLMKLAAGLLFRRCRNVLVTDLTWPSYRFILDGVRSSARNQLTALSLRKRILADQISQDQLVDRVVGSFLREGCDGLFLPVVDNLGVRLPIERIVRCIQSQAELRFVVLDGAQAFCHVPLRLAQRCCDFFIAGCHKWLRAYQPMGLGFYGHPRSEEYVRRAIRRFQRQGIVDDPLLCFVGELEGGSPAPYGETVNLAPLFTCQGALEDVSVASIASGLPRRMKNADQLAAIVRSRGWRPLVTAREFRSGILLLQAEAIDLRKNSPDVLRRRFHQAGLAVSTYPQGLVRISLPAEPWHTPDLDLVQRAFRHVAEDDSGPALPVGAHAITSL